MGIVEPLPLGFVRLQSGSCVSTSLPVFALTPSRGECALETELQKLSSLSQKLLSLYLRDRALETDLDI